MVLRNDEERRKPLLSLKTAVPDPKLINIDDEMFEMRAVESYSARERKRLQSLLTAIIEYEAADEDEITTDDEQTYFLALRQVTDISMPDLPPAVHNKLEYMHYGAIASEVIKLFRERNAVSEDDAPKTDESQLKPKRLRKLREKLSSQTLYQPSFVSTEDDRVVG